MRLNKKPSKFWIYFPLYSLLIGVISTFLWNQLNSEEVSNEPVIEPAVKLEEPTKPDGVVCFNESCKELSGIFELWPEAFMDLAFRDMSSSCQDHLCQMCRGSFSSEEMFDNPCFREYFNVSYAYHNDQLSKYQILPMFYNTGVTELSVKQRERLETILSTLKNRNFGAVIIGRASKVGNQDSNRKISQLRAKKIQEVIENSFENSFPSEYIYFGAKPPQLSVEIANNIDIDRRWYENIIVSGQKKKDYSLRINQSALIIFYNISENPFGIN